MTLRDLATYALQRLGVVAAGETLSSEDAADVLIACNALVDQWAAERLSIYTITRTTWAIVASTASYSVSLGDSRPVYVESIGYIDTSQTPDAEYSLGLPLTDGDWAAIAQKDLTNTVPSAAYWNATFPTGTVTFWPVPTSTALQGVIYTPNPISEFATLDTMLSVPPGNRRALITNLSVELAPIFHAEVTRELAMAAEDSKAAIQRANVRPWLKTPDPALVPNAGGRWNLQTDFPTRGGW